MSLESEANHLNRKEKSSFAFILKEERGTEGRCVWSLQGKNSFLDCCPRPWRQQTQKYCLSNQWSLSLEPASVLLGI